jgi:hypothetical protein
VGFLKTTHSSRNYVDSKGKKSRVRGLFEITVPKFLYRDLENELNRNISICGGILPSTSGTHCDPDREVSERFQLLLNKTVIVSL